MQIYIGVFVVWQFHKRGGKFSVTIYMVDTFGV